MSSAYPNSADWQKYSEQGQKLLEFAIQNCTDISKSKVREPENKNFEPKSEDCTQCQSTEKTTEKNRCKYATIRAKAAMDWLVVSKGFPTYNDALVFLQTMLSEKVLTYKDHPKLNYIKYDDRVLQFRVMDGEHLKRRIGMVRIWDAQEDILDPTSENPDNPFAV